MRSPIRSYTPKPSPVRATTCCARSGSRSGWAVHHGLVTSHCLYPYLDTAATRAIGVSEGSCGHANHASEQMTEIVGAYFPLSSPLACHVHGDAGADTVP